MMLSELSQGGMLALTLIPLLLCSIVALALILDALLRMLLTPHLRGRTAEAIETSVLGGHPFEALDRLIAERAFFSRSASLLKARAADPKPLRDEAVSLALSQDVRELTARRSALVTLAGLSPMLGLLGTVLGMMEAFRALEAFSGPIEPSVVAGGLWQAMITTGVGLAIAAPCLLVSALVKSWADRKAARAGVMLSQISIALERQGASS